MASSSFLAVLIGLALGALLAGGSAWALCAPRLREQRTRIDQLLRSLGQTSDMLMQARKQVEAVQKELDAARRNRVAPQPASVRLTDPKPTTPSIEVNSGFADTLLETPPRRSAA